MDKMKKSEVPTGWKIHSNTEECTVLQKSQSKYLPAVFLTIDFSRCAWSAGAPPFCLNVREVPELVADALCGIRRKGWRKQLIAAGVEGMKTVEWDAPGVANPACQSVYRRCPFLERRVEIRSNASDLGSVGLVGGLVDGHVVVDHVCCVNGTRATWVGGTEAVKESELANFKVLDSSSGVGVPVDAAVAARATRMGTRVIMRQVTLENGQCPRSWQQVEKPPEVYGVDLD